MPLKTLLERLRKRREEEREGGMGPENLLSARERWERKGRPEKSSVSVPVREREERSRAVTWRRGPHVTPCQEQCVVVFHEERAWVGSSLMEDALNERRARYSEIRPAETNSNKNSTTNNHGRSLISIIFWGGEN